MFYILSQSLELVLGLYLLSLFKDYELVVGEEVVVVELSKKLRLIVLESIELRNFARAKISLYLLYVVFLQTFLRTKEEVHTSHAHLPYCLMIIRSLPWI